MISSLKSILIHIHIHIHIHNISQQSTVNSQQYHYSNLSIRHSNILAMFAKSILIAAISLTGAFAAPAADPSATTLERRQASRTAPSKVTHTVVAGRGGLKFEPDNIVAEIGEIVEFHYLPKNHSVAQSSFEKPCVPLDNGASFFSGFQPVAEGQSNNVFQITVKDKTPIWFYCSQPVGAHCKNGMSGSINQNFSSQKTLAKYREAAALTGAPVSPPYIGGGVVIPNPNPLAGV